MFRAVRQFSLKAPRLTAVGRASVELPKMLALLAPGARRVGVVTDAFCAATSLESAVCVPLRCAGYEITAIFSEVPPDPCTVTVARCAAALRAGEVDVIVALGGGSPLDASKAASCLVAHGGRMVEYKAPRVHDLPGLAPLIAIPTTAGTGSEATRFTVITDAETQEKMLCVGDGFIPDGAILDCELTLSKPAALTAHTGVDALCHAMEAYVSRKHNADADVPALKALTAIPASLRAAFVDGADLGARETMLIAAYDAGIAFSNSSVTLIHGMSRPLGAHFKVPHGLSNAILAPLVTRFSVKADEARYAEVARALGAAPVASSDAQAASALPDALHRLNVDLQVPSAKEAIGVDDATFLALVPRMAQDALASGSPNNNPLVPTADEIEILYRKLWNGEH